MRKEDKGVIIGQLAETVKQYGHFYLVDTTAMDAAKTSELRRKCFKAGIKLVVVKNSLLHKALMSMEGVDFSPLFDSLKGTTSVMFSEVANAPAKLLKEYKNMVWVDSDITICLQLTYINKIELFKKTAKYLL